MTKVPDAEFIALWNQHKSASKVAKIVGTSERCVYSRRRRLEARRSIELEFKGFNPDIVKTNYRSGIHKVKGPVIIFSDAHVWPDQPYTPAYYSMLKLISELSPRLVVMNGDLFDGASISRFPSSGHDDVPSMIEELETAKNFLSGIEDAAPKGCNLVFTIGNHDQRWATRLAALPEFKNMPGFSLQEHFEAWEFCWSLVLNQGVDGGETFIKHRMHNGIHSAHTNALRSGSVHIITGHSHQLRCHPFSDYKGRRWSIETGMLGPMPLEAGSKFLYAEDNPSQCTQGFVVLHYGDDYRMLPPELVETVYDAKGKPEVYFRGRTIKFRGK